MGTCDRRTKGNCYFAARKEISCGACTATKRDRVHGGGDDATSAHLWRGCLARPPSVCARSLVVFLVQPSNSLAGNNASGLVYFTHLKVYE